VLQSKSGVTATARAVRLAGLTYVISPEEAGPEFGMAVNLKEWIEQHVAPVRERTRRGAELTQRVLQRSYERLQIRRRFCVHRCRERGIHKDQSRKRIKTLLRNELINGASPARPDGT
jgi:uroporphyrinogen-III synthase